MTNREQFISLSEAAKKIGVSKATIKRNGLLKMTRFNTAANNAKLYVLKADVTRLINQRMEEMK